MREQSITIKITREGKITADADGFAGDVCIKDLRRLLEGLAPGAASIDRKGDEGIARIIASRTQDLRNRT